MQRHIHKLNAHTTNFRFQKNHQQVLSGFLVNAKDRKYQFWERNELSVDIWFERVLEQKLTYLSENPVTAGLGRFAEEYKYSSALFYKAGICKRRIMTPFR